MNLIAAYERTLENALRVKVEEDMLETLFPGDEATKEKYRAHGFGRPPLSPDQQVKDG